ncbi:uncharacterized protein LOC121610924 [Chelmon rostratus]|uniref:uncharacterized protein LOC121610924 n=1 Tax=Chelmon rostratus TaxID=109905 RepID=UPI001BE4F836|nr:uncharacterized protein LOC121610924 [Chelmon rostratus]
MSLREKQQMNLDSESAAHTGMECQSRSSQKYLLLQVWCGILTVAMVVMAAVLTSIKPKSDEISFHKLVAANQEEVTTLKPDVTSAVSTIMAPLKSIGTASGSTPSYIELVKYMHSWQTSHSCDLCSLVLRNDSILCTKDSVYFMYAQVTFSKNPSKNQTRRVILKRNASFGRSARILTESTFPHTTEGSVWVAKIVSLLEGDSVILNITDDFLRDSKYTFWGAYPLH